MKEKPSKLVTDLRALRESGALPAAVALASTSFRLDAETKRLIRALAEQLGVRDVDVLRLAIRALAKKEGVR